MNRDTVIRFWVRDLIDHPFYWWPQTLLSYPVNLRGLKARPGNLSLKRVDTGEEMDFQLSNAITEDGFLVSTLINFFSDLPAGTERVFELCKSGRCINKPVSTQYANEYCENDSIVLDNGMIRVRIPTNREGSSRVPGPVMQVDRGNGWIGDSHIVSGKHSIQSITSQRTDSGPLFIAYRVTYHFEGGGQYTAVISCIAGMDFIRISEEMRGLSKDDEVFVITDWSTLSPTHRQSSQHPFANVYRKNEYLGYEGEKIDEPVFNTQHGLMNAGNYEGELPFRLGLYEPWNQYAILSHACFWNINTGDTLGVFIDRAEKWQDYEYAVFFSSDTLQVRYYHNKRNFYWKWPLVSGTRSTAITFYHHKKDIELMESLESLYKKASKGLLKCGFIYNIPLQLTSYTYYLRSRYGILDLNLVKDWILEYPDTCERPLVVFTEGEYPAPDELERGVYCSPLVCCLPNHGVGATDSRMVYQTFVDGYNRLYPSMSERQRKRLTAVYLFMAYFHAGEDFMPFRTMLGGHPNFLSDVKSVPAYMAFLFPEHPMAKEWAEQFGKFLELNTRYHTRPAVRAWNAEGGRWTENLGTYVWAFIRPAFFAAYLLNRYTDGKNRFALERIGIIGKWLVNSLSSPIDAENSEYYLKKELTWNDGLLHPHYWGLVKPADGPRRVYIPQGAHSARRKPPRTMWALGLQLSRYDPVLAEHVMWAARPDDNDMEHPEDEKSPWDILYSPGCDNRGTNPHLKSIKLTGYGVILRSVVDTPDEIYLHLQQIDTGPNYRWGIAGEGGCGNIYYYAGGKAYSHNGREDAGDRYTHDTDFSCTFGVWKHGGFRAIGRNVLHRHMYNLGFVQFAEIVPRTRLCPYSWPEYQGRSIMLVGSDYFIVYDKVYSSTIVQRFSWFTHIGDDFPFIHFIKGGSQKTEITTDETKGAWYDGNGDCMALVTHKKGVSVEKTHFGCIARNNGWTDYVFRCRDDILFSEKGIQFKGTAGVIRESKESGFELAIFYGTFISAGGVTIETDEPELGISAGFKNASELAGTYIADKESSVWILLKYKINQASRIYIDGEELDIVKDGNGLLARLPAGEHKWQLTSALPVPAAPVILRTENRSGEVKVFFTQVPGAEGYHIELSRDNGTSWERTGETGLCEYSVKGLVDGMKVHVRVVAFNDLHESEPANEYPVYVTGDVPLPPDGLKAVIGEGMVELSWGEVLGVTEYRLYRRTMGMGEFTLAYSGLDRKYIENDKCNEVYKYSVSTVNGNGEGTKSSDVDTDPASWSNWDPMRGEKFRRRFTGVYDSKPFSVFEYGMKPFTDSGYETWETGADDITRLECDEDDAQRYPD